MLIIYHTNIGEYASASAMGCVKFRSGPGPSVRDVEVYTAVLCLKTASIGYSDMDGPGMSFYVVRQGEQLVANGIEWVFFSPRAPVPPQKV